MNKKFLHLFFASVLMLSSLSPALSLDRKENGGNRENGPTTLGEKFNGGTGSGPITQGQMNKFRKKFASLELLFNAAVNAAKDECNHRLSDITTAGLGISQGQFDMNFTNSGLTIERFILANLVADLSGVPLTVIVEQARTGLSFADIALQNRVNTKLFLILVSDFTVLFNDEALIASGTIQPNLAERARLFNLAVANLSASLERLSTRVGTARLDTFFNQRLSFETGLTLTEIVNLRAGLPAGVTTSQFAVALITANSINFNLNGPITLGSELFTNEGAILALQNSNLPATLIVTRLALFNGGLSASLRQR